MCDLLHFQPVDGEIISVSTSSKATCKRTQQFPTLLGSNVESCYVRLHVAKSLTGFKLCATTHNNMQKGVQADATCNIKQYWELLAIDVASVRSGLRVF